jgi:uncharacterized protein YndB with AHSA1/START domain
MAIRTCPTDVVDASAQHVFTFLVQPELLALWTGAHLLSGPRRAVAPGDRLILRPALGLRATLEVVALQPPLQLEVDVQLPFGIANHEVIHLTPMDGERCRVTFN